MTKVKKFGLWLGTMASMAPMFVSAAIDNENFSNEVSSISKIDDLWGLIQVGLDWFLTFIVVIGAVMIILGGFKYMTGDSEGGRKQLTYGVIGVLIALGAWTIIAIARNFFGL